MAHDPATPPAARVLFCPFCGESFEGSERCPDHDLPLVAWHQLPRPPADAALDAPVARLSPRHGRGLLLATSALSLLAFVALPLATVRGEHPLGGTMLALATHGAHRLWLVPAAAATSLLTVVRRRTRAELRAARLALALLALAQPAAVSWALRGVEDAVAALSARSGQPLALELGAGPVAIWIAGIVALYASLTLARTRSVPPAK